MQPRARRIHRGRVGLQVWEWDGTDPGALLLHGIGNYGRYWDFVASQIGGRLHLVAPDARGHGESDAPAHGYTDEEYVADALVVADAFGLERFVLAGHSLGGRHGVSLAAAHPARVLGLLVIDAGPEALPEGSERARRLTAERPASFADDAEALTYLRRTSPGYADAVYENRLRWALHRAADGTLAWRSSREALLETMASGAGGRAWEALGAVRCPVVVLRGTRSYSLGGDAARRMVQVIPGARLVEVDAGHNVALERPWETADELLRLATASATG